MKPQISETVDLNALDEANPRLKAEGDHIAFQHAVDQSIGVGVDKQ